MADQNFDLIWGQDSPLDPYEFSDADYREGWDFVRSTPPTKGMFDAVQRKNDLKAQNLNRRLASVNVALTEKMDKTQVATATVLGGVKSSAEDGAVQVGADGTMKPARATYRQKKYRLRHRGCDVHQRPHQ